MIDQEKTIELLKKIVSINSMNPDLSSPEYNENELAEYLGKFLSEMGLEVTYQEKNQRKNVIGILRGRGDGKSLILNGHTDTVGPEGMEQPLNPEIKDGKLFGRGAYDMKGGLVSSIMAIDAIIREGIELGGDVIFAGVTDEEFASIGTEQLVEEYSSDAAIICEPTNSRIVIANKGFSWLKITVHGKAAHGSKPHLGIDAIDKARKVMNEIAELQNKLRKQDHPLVGHPAIRVTKVEGGLGLSTIPDKCILHIERRTLPHVKKQQVISEIGDILTKISAEDSDFDAEFELIIFRGGLELAEDEEIVSVISNAYENITGEVPVYAGEPWWMDSALMGEHGIPTVVLGPNGDGAHAKIEYVEIHSVIKIAEIIRSAIISFCS